MRGRAAPLHDWEDHIRTCPACQRALGALLAFEPLRPSRRYDRIVAAAVTALAVLWASWFAITVPFALQANRDAPADRLLMTDEELSAVQASARVVDQMLGMIDRRSESSALGTRIIREGVRAVSEGRMGEAADILSGYRMHYDRIGTTFLGFALYGRRDYEGAEAQFARVRERTPVDQRLDSSSVMGSTWFLGSIHAARGDRVAALGLWREIAHPEQRGFRSVAWAELVGS